MAGRPELLIFVLTFLTSTWYIKNPFLKSKINDVRCRFLTAYGSLTYVVCQVLLVTTQYYGRERTGLLGNMLNTDPVALQHLIPALTHFYIGESNPENLFPNTN
jgi:ubiquitin conjugation factor E4 B